MKWLWLLKRHLIRLIHCNGTLELIFVDEKAYTHTHTDPGRRHCAQFTLIFLSIFSRAQRTRYTEYLLLCVCVRVVIVVAFLSSPFPNKFNLNCLQPAHALDTRQPHLRYCIYSVFGSYSSSAQFANAFHFELRESVCAFCVYVRIGWHGCMNTKRINCLGIKAHGLCAINVQHGDLISIKMCVDRNSCKHAHTRARSLARSTQNKKGNVRVYRLILMFTRIENAIPLFRLYNLMR